MQLSMALILPLLLSGQPRADWRVGAAVADITPDYLPQLPPMLGYGARHKKPAQGVHDRLVATALVVERQGQRLALVSLDVCWISAALRQQVCRLAQQAGLAPDSIVLAASNTHSGPAGLDSNLAIQQAFGKYQPELTAETARRVVEALRKATGSARPAQLHVAQTTVDDLAERASDGHPEKVALSVLGFKAQGRWWAIFVSLPVRADVLPGENMLFSADWPGYMRSALVRATGAATVAFAVGASASLVPQIPDGQDDFAAARAFGERVASRAVAALDTARPVPAGPLRVRTATYSLPPAVPPPGVKLPVPLPVARAILPHRTIIQAARIGDLALVAIPGAMSASLVAEVSDRLHAAGARTTILLGAANSHAGYFLSPAEYRADNCDVRFCLFGRDAGQQLADKIADLAASLF